MLGEFLRYSLLSQLKHHFAPYRRSPSPPWGENNHLTSGNQGKGGKRRRQSVRPSGYSQQLFDVLCVKVWLPGPRKKGGPKSARVGLGSLAWQISEEGEGRRFPATFRRNGVAAPGRVLLALFLLADCIRISPHHQPSPTLLSPASHLHRHALAFRVSSRSHFLLGGASSFCIQGLRCFNWESQAIPPTSPPLLRARCLTKAACH